MSALLAIAIGFYVLAIVWLAYEVINAPIMLDDEYERRQREALMAPKAEEED